VSDRLPLDRSAQAEFGPVEGGDPASDIRGFRRSLGHFATGVTVVAAQYEGQPFGMTANSFSSVSLDPPLISVCIARTARSLPHFLDATHFAVNVLTSEQLDVASRFVQPGIDRFSQLMWQPGHGGAPVLGDVSAAFECMREAAHEAGDHVILIGRVLRFARYNRAPLLFAQGRYGRIADHLPAFGGSVAFRSDNAPPPRESVLTWLRRARDRLSSAFEVHRLAVGLTLNQARILIFLAERHDATLESIARECLLGPLDAEEALASTLTQGDVVIVRDDRYAISNKGRERQNDLLMRAAAFETEQLAGFSPADVDATRRVLASLSGATRPSEPRAPAAPSREHPVAKEHG
jgi:4-hydroxyphenylacetate 3-hydroxylase, reductase component